MSEPILGSIRAGVMDVRNVLVTEEWLSLTLESGQVVAISRPMLETLKAAVVLRDHRVNLGGGRASSVLVDAWGEEVRA